MDKLTLEQILAMTAGVELDVLVAECVMGGKTYYPAVFGANTSFPDGKMRGLPSYSTDISAAWEVLEMMREKGVYITIETYADFFQALPFRKNESLISAAVVSLPNVEEAICKASLLAVMAE